MKKIKIILIAAALLCGASAYAQQDWNASFGYASTAFHGEDCSAFLTSHDLRGVYGGVRREFYFSALAGLTFEPGLLFYYQSGRSRTGTSPKYIKMHYLSVPLDVKYTFGLSGATTGAFFTGPVLNVGVLGNLYEKGKFETNREVADPMHQLTRVNLQWNIGLALTVADAVQLRACYAMGISRLIPERELHNNTLSVGVGLLF